MKISDLSLSPPSSPSIKLPINLPHSLPRQPHPTRLLLPSFGKMQNILHPLLQLPSLSSLSLEISSWSRATMANRTSDLLRRVDPALQLDENALLRYASANVDGFPISPSIFTVSQVSFSLSTFSLSLDFLFSYGVSISFVGRWNFQFGHGQSNPTYLLEACSGSSASPKRYVLRKKPPGKLLDSAHAVEREFKVQFLLFFWAKLINFIHIYSYIIYV